MGRPLDQLVTLLDAVANPRVTVLVLFFALPAVAFALAFFGSLGGELAIANWTIDARLRMPRPPWGVTDAIAATLLVLTTLLVLAMAAHGISG